MVMPGLVNVHSHLGHEPVYRGIREEHGVPNMYMTSLYERSQAFDVSDPALRRASLEVALCEVLKSGVTTVCDISPIYDGWADIVGKSGIRGFLAPGFADARWKLSDDHSLGFDSDEARGRKGLDAALAFIDGLPKHPSGMLSGVVSPMQIENCSERCCATVSTPRRSGASRSRCMRRRAARAHEMARRHGTTSIRHVSDIRISDPRTSSATRSRPTRNPGSAGNQGRHPPARRGRMLGAHCPTPFARYGIILESFGDYARAGVNMAMGTDTTPHNMLEEIRKAGTFARIASRHVNNVSTGMLLNAATVAGAKALMRDDRKLAIGAQADIVLVKVSHSDMTPARDPLRSLVFHAADRAVKDVYVAGRKVVSDGKATTLDHAAACASRPAQAKMMQLPRSAPTSSAAPMRSRR